MILLSFDIEEFDAPLEHGVDIPFEQQIALSIEGTRKILTCLRRNDVHATFFCTANFASHAPELIRKIQAEGHEIASHGYNHSSFEVSDLKRSRELLEQIIGHPVRGLRTTSTAKIDEREVAEAGYTYNSSLNPTYLPGRCNNRNQPRTWFYKEGVLQLPISVTPILRFPLFWMTYHNLPATFYRWLFMRTLKHDGYVATYFHPWEFMNLRTHKEWKLPFIMTNHSGENMIERLDDLVRMLKRKKYPFGTYSQFIHQIK